MKLFDTFDFSLLNDPEFKEDAVREELINPLLGRLSYSASGPNKIVRSRSLKHPFVHIGTKSNAVTIIPDYTLIVEDKPRWILDAKSPTETLVSGKNPEQAFSYAIHPDVRVNRYALCNGHSLVVFDVSRREPVLNISLNKINKHWDDVRRLLSPIAFIKPQLLDYSPDFGLFLLKTGVRPETKFIFLSMGVPMLAKTADGQYTLGVRIQFGKEWLMASFDFDELRFDQLIKSLSKDQANQVKRALSNYPFRIVFEGSVPEVGIEAKLGSDIISNENGDYCPLDVGRFFSVQTAVG